MKRVLIWVLVIVGILIAIRIVLPFVAEKYANNAIEKMEGYYGSLDEININLFRGGYVIEGLTVYKDSDAIQVPFISIPTIDLSVEWDALFNGAIVGKVLLEDPVINFAVTEEVKQDGTETNWPEVFKELLPIRINQFEIIDGNITYFDFTMKPEIEVYVDSLDMIMTNLTNIERESDSLYSILSATGYTLGGGNINIDAQFSALQEIPGLDLTMNIENVNMTALNKFIRAYSNLDVEQGTFNLYSEIVIDDAILDGYVRPVLENLEILDWDEEKGGFFSKAWEAVAGGVRAILENSEEDQVATQTPLEGNLNQMNLDAGIWPSIWGLFKNAFVEALSKRTDNAIEFPLQE